MHSDIYEWILFNCGMMIDTTELFVLSDLYIDSKGYGLA